MDEPMRRYLERQVNHRLTGYTVQIRALRVHPWIGSFELYDASIVQDANPDPPVTHVARLVTSIDWRALLDRGGSWRTSSLIGRRSISISRTFAPRPPETWP